MGTYKFYQDHLHGTDCQWCKAVATKKSKAAAAKIEQHFERKSDIAGYAIIGMFILAVCVNIF